MAIALLVTASVVPVITKAFALQRRLETLQDSQLFVALSAAQTDASSLQRSIPALEEEAAKLQVAAASLRNAVSECKNITVLQEVRDVRSRFRALIETFR